jgi:tetratricopeptide (TPR) repeat protein
VKLALDCEQATTEKAKARGKPCNTVPHILFMLKQAQSLAAIVAGDADPSIALDCAVQAELCCDNPVDKAIAGQLVGAAHLKAGSDHTEIIDAYLNAFECGSQLSLADMQTNKYIPLSSFIVAAKILGNAGRFADMLALLLFGCTVYSSSSLFMLVGVSCIRLDRLTEAEDALLEANLIDNRNAEVWAYLSMVCMITGPHRLEEAEKALFQALRLGLCTASLLRELAMTFMSADKLEIAEDLVRRAVVAESRGSSGRSLQHNRKLLADILAGQNKAASAVDEYQVTIADEEADTRIRLEAATRCAELLTSLGRDEEARSLGKIIAALRGNE